MAGLPKVRVVGFALSNNVRVVVDEVPGAECLLGLFVLQFFDIFAGFFSNGGCNLLFGVREAGPVL